MRRRTVRGQWRTAVRRLLLLHGLSQSVRFPIPFIGVSATQVRFSGETRQVSSTSIRGSEAVRNRCAVCGGLVFGGVVGKDESHTLYAGSLDDSAVFRPSMAIFVRDRPNWMITPEGLALFETMPG